MVFVVILIIAGSFYVIYTFCSFVKQESSQICGGGAAAEVRHMLILPEAPDLLVF